MASTGPQEDASGATHRTILTLPEECQKEIISHCSQSDLICLSLVCKQFRELAAAEIYRKFHIVFPDEDDHAFESSIDGLAGGLDTFVTSDYDYAKHLKDLSLDTLSAGSKAEAAYKPYLYSVSCGKFMNTLLLLTLRKAKTLETFTWNIRVELSRPVYHALHQIKTLSHLHIRLQAGPSLYETPPALPYPIPPLFEPPVPTSHPSSLGPPPPPPPLPAFGAPPVFYVGNATSVPPPPPPKPPTRTRAPKKSSHSINEPPTLSGFKNLRTLSVLDIDNLDVITEIKKCVRNSSSSLSKLKLSFSDALALQARKPPPDIDPEDSDPDDEFQVVPVPQSSGQNISDDATGPAKAFRAQEERKTQEAVLGRIFDVEPYLVKQGPKPPVRKAETPKEEKSAAPNPGKDFINAIKAVSHRLMKDLNGSTAFDTKQQEILDIIESAARKYVAEEEPKTAKDESNGAEGSSSSAASKTEAPETAAEESAEAKAAGSSSLFKDAAGKGKDVDKEVTPEDIDVEEPEDQLALEPGDAPSASNKETAAASEAASEATPTSQPTPTPPPAASVPEGTIQEPKIHADLSSIEKAVTNLNAQKQNFQTLAEKLLAFGTQANQLNKEIMEHRNGGAPFDVARIREAEQQMNGCSQTIQEIQKEMATVQAEIDDAEKLLPTAITEANSTGTREQTSKRIKDYIRSTRGMALKSLAVYLIPVKASVLCKAVDLRVLQKVTLLNVGPQAPIWMQFAKENRLEPIALRKIFTDNVGSAFLTFVSQLEELHEFFILERDNKYKPESFAPATTVTIDHIRRLVLKKHLPTLKRLLIKNMASQEWDMDEKSILLITRKGKNLEELSMSMNISAVHVLSQHIFGLKNLRALHVIQLRNDDTCMWVMRETRRFLIDNLSHYPEMKLEWLSIDDEYRVERIVRPDDPESKKSQKKNKAKGKQKAKASLTNGFNDTFPVLPVDALDGLTDSSGDEDDDSMALKLETIEGLPYYDVWGVKIFKKEVVNGRL